MRRTYAARLIAAGIVEVSLCRTIFDVEIVGIAETWCESMAHDCNGAGRRESVPRAIVIRFGCRRGRHREQEREAQYKSNEAHLIQERPISRVVGFRETRIAERVQK